MPAPSFGDVVVRSQRPQPRPRLSLLATDKNEEECRTLYENLRNLSGRLPDPRRTEETQATEEKDANAPSDCRDHNHNMASSNHHHHHPSRTSPASRRSTTLPSTHGTTSIPVRRHANTMGGGRTLLVSTAGVTLDRNPRTVSTPSRLPSSTSTSSTPGNPLKCVPYNSPRPVKSNRFAGTADSVAADGGRLQTASTAATRPFNYRYVSKVAVKVNGESTNANTINGDDQAVAPRGPLLAVTNVRRHQQLQLSRLNGKSSLSSSRESVSDSTTSLSSSTTDTGRDTSPGCLRRRPSNTSEYRKSASIPPQLVANLTSQFNSLIRLNQLTPKSMPEASSLVTKEVAATGVTKEVALTNKQNGSGVGAACPSPPSLQFSLRPLSKSSPRRDSERPGLLGPKPEVATYSVSLMLNHRRGRPKAFALTSSGNDRGYVSATDGNESSDADEAIQQHHHHPRRLTSSSDCLSSEAEASPEPKFNPNLGPVRAAIRCYEVALAKATSSPEFPRKCRTGDPVVSAVERQVQTLPATSQPPSRLMNAFHQRDGAVRTLPHATWSSARDIAPATASLLSYTHHLPPPARPPSSTNSELHSKLLDSLKEQRERREAKKEAAPPASSPSIDGSTSKSVNLPTGAGAKCHPANRPLPALGGRDEIFRARPALVVNQTSSLSAVDGDADGSVSSRGQLLYRQRAKFLSDAANRKSMDLLAEIDDHRRAAMAAESSSSGESCAPNASFLWSDSTQTQMHQERPNPFYVSSFPDGESASSSSSSGVTLSVDGFVFPIPDGENGGVGFDDEEHLYEELFNCRSRPLPVPGLERRPLPVPGPEQRPLPVPGPEQPPLPPLPLLPPPRVDRPLSLPSAGEGCCGSSDESGSTEVATYALNRDAMCEKTDEVLCDLIPDCDSDESWIDDSDDERDKNSRNSSSLNNKVKTRGKRQSGRKVLIRRSWSRSLRDLVTSQDPEAEAYGRVASGDGPWEDGPDSDDSPGHVYNKLDVQLAKENCALSDEATDSVTPDTDSDKSPTSANGEHEEGDMLNPSITNGGGKSTSIKVKKVKRNWSWTKTDFRLDFTSKMRLNRKQATTMTTVTNGDVIQPPASADLSPTKRRQWIFKAKSVSTHKKVAAAVVCKVVSPKRTPSPKKESAQFYIPTRNSDGTLTSPSACMASLDWTALLASSSDSNGARPVSSSSESRVEVTISKSSVTVATTITTVAASVAGGSVHSGSTSNLSTCSTGTVSSRKTRRVSNPGLISRPTTAPPAPPIGAILRGTSVSLDHSLSGDVPPPCGLRRMNSGSSDASSKASKRSLDGQNSVGGSLSSSVSAGNHRSSSSVSSEGETSTTLTRRTTTRSSITSAHSNSSCESCPLPEEPENDAGSQTGMLSRFLLSDPTANDDSSSDTLTADARACRDFLDLGSYFCNYDDKNLKLSPFEDEPLYQFYNKAAQERSAHENQMDGSDDDCYESVYQMAPDTDPASATSTLKSESISVPSCLPSAMDLVKSTQGGARTLWCEVPEVRACGILDSIDPQRRKLQEAMFEVITSEASYLKSLNILVNHFMLCPAFSDDYSINCVLNRRERHVLFSDVVPVRETSERLLAALEKRWQENIVLSDICDILQEHATKYFDVYVKYCSNQIYQDRCIKQLKETNSQFVDILRNLESSGVCQNLSMYSFLMLPMQRITRMPLLVDAIFNRLVHGTKEFESCKHALATINKLVHECNEGALRMERMEEMLLISRQLDFGEFKALALISASRWLVKKGELSLLTFGEGSKIPFGKRCSRLNVYVFLFTDLLIITTKKKGEDGYNVLDHCPRNMVQVMEIERPDQLPERPPDGCRSIFQLTMLQNHDNKTVEMYLSCCSESDLTRWMEAVPPKRSDNPDERIYEEWDCPQVQAIHCYVSQQPDELSLEESDVVNVFRKMADGWYQGERIRDGVQGWFPSTFTVEIVSSHVRARNLRQRYRLLALSYSYMEEQRKKEGKCK